jgi:hypothetical protein
MEKSRATNGRQADSEESSNTQTQKKTKHMAPTVEMGDQRTLKEDGTGDEWPNPPR